MPALLVWCYADGVFSWRRFERAAVWGIDARFIAANTHPGHDTIATRWNTRSACRTRVLAEAGFANWRPRRSRRRSQLPTPSRTGPRPAPGQALRLPPPSKPKPERRIREPRRLAMTAKRDSQEGKSRCGKPQQTLEPVFGIINSAIGFTPFHRRRRAKVNTE
jgi:hypothetical protein